MLKKVLMCITCLACLFGCSSTKEETKESSKDQTVAKEEVKEEDKQDEITTEKKEESYDKKDPLSSTSSEKQSSDNKTNNTSTSTTVKDQEVPTSPPSSKSAEEPSVPVTPTPAPEPVVPSVACPGGIDQNQTCDVILDQNYYFATFSSESEAASQGQYYLDEVMYIGDVEITNYSIQPVYRNDRSIGYYGLNLWSNGILIQ